MTKPATVYIVDDDQSAAGPIAKMVEAIGLRAEAYPSAEAFLHHYTPTGPACLVLDVRMPEVSGVALQQRLAEAEIKIPIIVISAYAEVRLAVRVMRNGALNFLEKPFRMHELAESIQEAIRLDREAWRRREEQARTRQRFNQLKPPERQVLDLVAIGKTNKMIAAELGVSIRTVENRRASIKRKLQVESRVELLALLTSSGSAGGAAGGEGPAPEAADDPDNR